MECIEGIDTLIVHLLASIGDGEGLEEFLSTPQNVRCRSAPHRLANQ